VSSGRLASWTGLGAALIGVLSGFHGRLDDVVGAVLILVACTIVVAVWEE
jgi:hypothetical protein